jgi:Holliday junction resolvasome RuvABC endonuclease subunit
MLVWGLDLSLANTGVTIYDTEQQEFIYIGSIDTDFIKSRKANKHLYLNGIKLKHLWDEMSKLREQYPPEIISIERGFSRFNTATQVIYRVHGIINLMFQDIPQIYYPPKTVKEAILKGDATKAQLQKAINVKYNDITFANEDESDSFAVCLTYLIKEGLIEWVKPELPKKRVKAKAKKEPETKVKVVEREHDLVELTINLNDLMKGIKDEE